MSSVKNEMNSFPFKYLKKYGVAIDGIITLSKINKDYIIETLEYLKSLEIYNVAIMLLASVGNADDNYDNTYLSFDELCEVIKDVCNAMVYNIKYQ